MLKRPQVAALALLATLFTLPAAASALSPALPPTHARELRGAGWKVTWPSPSRLASAKGGTTLRVKVAPLRTATAGARVKLALVRLDANGRPGRTVASRTLRSGTFGVKLPAATPGTRYAFTIRAAGRSYRVPFTTAGRETEQPVVTPPAPAPVPPAPAPPAGGIPEYMQRCLDGQAARAEGMATLTVHRAAAHPDDVVDVTLANTGGACLTYGAWYAWERLVDGRWELAWSPRAVIGIAYHMGIGASRTWQVHVNEEFQPGRYRMVLQLHYDISPVNTWPPELIYVRPTAEIDVVARP